MGDFYGTGIEIWAGFGLNGQKRGQKCSTGQRFNFTKVTFNKIQDLVIHY